MALTVKELESIKPTGKRFEVSDKDGLSVRVSATGKKIFQYRYRRNGKQQRYDYGDFGQQENQLTLAKARELHYRTKNEISEGYYPNQLDSGAKEIKTVSDIFNSWYEIYCKKNRKNPEYARDLIAADITPRIGHIKPAKLTKAHFRDLLDVIIQRGSMTQAEKCRAICKQVCRWAAERDYIKKNPLQEFSASAIGYKYKPKDRFLTDDEIGIVWNGLDLTGMETPTINALKIMMLTGLRRSEPYLAKWSDIDLKKKIWTIPKENNKSDRINEVMLSSLLIEVLENQKSYCKSIGGSIWVFPSSKNNSKHIDSNSATRAVKRHCDRNHWLDLDGNPIPDWTPHALRHTFETKLTEIGIEYIVMKRMINHAIGGMSDIYNHAQLNDKKLDAMERWADKIRNITNKDHKDE